MWRTIGLMSGTSLDGVDAAAIQTDGVSIGRIGPALTLPYPPSLRAELRRLLDRAPELDPADPWVAEVTRHLTTVHARAVAELGQPADLIGFHGQTILHQPDRRRSWQIGDADALARATGTTVAHDFRSADVAAGGQGAPLAPVFHAAVAAALPRPLAVLNLGGVANVTYLTASGLSAADVGPGNGPLDDWVARHGADTCDRDGRYSSAGRVDQAVLGFLLDDPFLPRAWPKSLDRLAFTARLAQSGLAALSLADGAATLVAFTAHAIARAPIQPAQWLVCGGGRHNPSLLRALCTALPAPVRPVEDVGWQGDALEAQCFGYLAARVVAGLPLSFPGTTGVPVAMVGGRVSTAGPGARP